MFQIERQRAAGPQHARDLLQRRLGIEPVERLSDGDRVDARIR